MEPQLEQLITSVEQQTERAKQLAAAVSDRVFIERPDPAKWSMAEHLAHLVLVNRPYLGAMEAAVERGRARGLMGTGPFKGKWFAARFVRSMEPPPRWRFKTLKEMKPGPYLNTATVLADFEEVQKRFVTTAEAADGLHLGKVVFHSPFTRFLRFTLLQGFEMLETHNRRHMWHMDQIAGAQAG